MRDAVPRKPGGDGVTDDGARHRAHTRTPRPGGLYNRRLKRHGCSPTLGTPRGCEVDAMAIPTHLPNVRHRHRYRQPAIRREPGIVGGPAGGVCRPNRCLSQGGGARILIHSPNVRACAQTRRGRWMPAVSPVLVEGDEIWLRRRPYSRVRKPRTATVSAAHTLHNATVSAIHREVIGVAYPPARHSRPTYGPWTRGRGASRRSGQPHSTMAAGQSDPRGLGHAWRLASRGVERFWTMILHKADLPETAVNITLSGRFA